MKAVVQQRYGPAAAVLSVRDVETPAPTDDQVLVRVHAASMHPDVWHVVEGVPLALRLFGNGLLKPSRRIPGTDLSGRVESIGRKVTEFAVGDEVFGESVQLGWWNGGTYAEHVAVPAAFLVRKPANVTHEQAATVPASGFITLSNLGIDRKFQGLRVLINGAGGCVGQLAVQLVRAQGGIVTAVDCAARLEFIRSLGAERVVDYRQEDVAARSERYDFILDVASTLSHGEYKRILSPDGIYVPIGHAQFGKARGRMGGRIVGSLPYFVSRMLWSAMNPRTRSSMTMPSKQQVMSRFASLIEAGAITPTVARTFGLADVAEAMRCMEDETLLGRIVVVPR